jgi:hypothetical protein
VAERTEQVRAAVGAARRVVVKIGSSSLTSGSGGGLDPARLDRLVDALAGLRGREVVLVSSGAIAAGLAPLGLVVDWLTQDSAHRVPMAAYRPGNLAVAPAFLFQVVDRGTFHESQHPLQYPFVTESLSLPPDKLWKSSRSLLALAADFYTGTLLI